MSCPAGYFSPAENRREMEKDTKEPVSLKYDEVYREVFACENVRKQFLSDVLGIPLESITAARLVTPHLWRRYRNQKPGILDMALELNDDIKVNVELQIRRQKYWIKRQLFYLAKMYEEDLRIGQNYGKLKRCISIGILDFQLLEGEKYHSVYRVRDEYGEELTGLWEIHIIELRKSLQGSEVDDWIRLFNAKSDEELDMLAAKNKGLAEASEVIKRMSLRKTLRYWYEAHLKAVRDRYGEDEYIRDLGREEGREEGKAEGKAEAVLELLGEQGEIPNALKKRIQKETDLQILGKWLKKAAKTENISEFETFMSRDETRVE